MRAGTRRGFSGRIPGLPSGWAGADSACLGFGLLVGVGVCLPLFRPGFLWLLDWVPGGHGAVLPPSAFGLNGGLTTGLPFFVVVNAIARVLGGPGTWLPLFAFFPLACWGMGRLVGGPVARRLAAASLFSLNPFVFQRIFVGHVALLLGYVLLPLGVISLRRYLVGRPWWAVAPALWWAVMTAMSPHFVWIFGVLVLFSFLFAGLEVRAWLVKAAAVGASFTLLNSYIFFAHSATSLTAQVGTSADLGLYRTTSDPTFGLIGNVLGLYGFWRTGPGPTLPKSTVTGWPILMLAILAVVAVGAVLVTRTGGDSEGRESDARRTALVLGLSGLAGLFLAMGSQGPSGALFRWAYAHLPFFNIMREPQKFLMLTALAYAWFFGWGAEWLVKTVPSVKTSRRQLRAIAPVALAVLLPLAYTPTIFWGLAGQISVVRAPTSWTEADHVMGSGPGQLLFLPWHLYLSFPFTGRVTANPGSAVFTRSVISGDNLEAGGESTNSTSRRSAYLTGLFAHGSSSDHFGTSVNRLGVEYVALAQTVDWRSYEWLNHQSDLKLVFDRGGLEVWRNLAYAGPASDGRSLRELTPDAYVLGPGRAGPVTIDLPYASGWQLGTQPARKSPQGVLEVDAPAAGGRLTYRPWNTVRIGYWVSGAALVVLVAAVLVARRREREPEASPGDPGRPVPLSSAGHE